MDGLSAEVSEKIRAAIRAKLVRIYRLISYCLYRVQCHSFHFLKSVNFLKKLQKELGAYVDDELPDYIMVLVANKKTQEQMKDDLSLFLHNHADVFTDWLQDILNKLKQVATTGGKKKAGIQKLLYNPVNIAIFGSWFTAVVQRGLEKSPD